MRREKMNNKGFSLVELIIVIAIMAILSAALAPQLMKYIEKSRVSTDASTCASIESCVNAALAEEAIYKEVASAGAGGKLYINAYITKDATTGKDVLNFLTSETTKLPSTGLLCTELKETLGSLKEPKQTGKQGYLITIETGEDSTYGTTTVGKISVKTVAHQLADPKEK